MKTLIILDKAGTIGLQYAIVEGDHSKFAGLVLNRNTQKEQDCINFLIEGLKNDTIIFGDKIGCLTGQTWNKEALIFYY
jgi:hypothetical protein